MQNERTLWKTGLVTTCDEWMLNLIRIIKTLLIKSGSIRNEALVNAFSYMNLIEHWGSGIPRIVESVKEAGLREPELSMEILI